MYVCRESQAQSPRTQVKVGCSSIARAPSVPMPRGKRTREPQGSTSFVYKEAAKVISGKVEGEDEVTRTCVPPKCTLTFTHMHGLVHAHYWRSLHTLSLDKKLSVAQSPCTETSTSSLSMKRDARSIRDTWQTQPHQVWTEYALRSRS